MKKSDEKFVLKLVEKEVLAYSIALETRIKENLIREMNSFRINLQYRINMKLMRIRNSCLNSLNINNRKLDFLRMSISFKFLSKCIKETLKYNLNI